MDRQGTILIIDDDLDFAEAVRVILEQEGYGVFAADDGVKGIQMAREHKPDLVVLDLLMSPVDGITVCETLKTDPELSSTPVLVLTAVQEKMHLGPYSPELSSRLQADDYLDKPIDPNTLVTHIRGLVNRRERSQ